MYLYKISYNTSYQIKNSDVNSDTPILQKRIKIMTALLKAIFIILNISEEFKLKPSATLNLLYLILFCF